jgi:organic hydroperoxide reductase OsmC/OhrA
MNIYTLKFPDDGNVGALRLDFGAEDAADALVTAHRKASGIRSGRAAELWQGAHKLCTIRRAIDGAECGARPMRFQSA